MTTALLVLLASLTVLVADLVFRRAHGIVSVKRPTPYLLMFYGELMVASVVGATLMLLGFRSHPGLLVVRSEGAYDVTLLLVLWALLAVPLAMLLVNAAVGFKPEKELGAYLRAPTRPLLSRDDTAMLYVFVALTGVAVATTGYVLSRGAPLVTALGGDYGEVLAARGSFSRDFSGSLFLRNIIGYGLVPVASYAAFAYALHSKAFRWWVLFAVLSICSALLYLADLAKSPLAFYLLSFLFAYVLICGRVRFRTVVLAVGAFLTTVLVMYLALGASEFLRPGQLLKEGPLGRILVGQIVGLPNYLELFPEVHDYLYGSGVAFLRFLGLEPEQASRIAMRRLTPVGVALGVAGYQNTLFVGAAYANFGWLGVLLAPLWVGAVLQLLLVVVVRLPKTPVVVGWGLYAMMLLTQGLTGGLLSEFLFNTRLAGVTVSVVAVTLSGVVLHIVAGNHESRAHVGRTYRKLAS